MNLGLSMQIFVDLHIAADAVPLLPLGNYFHQHLLFLGADCWIVDAVFSVENVVAGDYKKIEDAGQIVRSADAAEVVDD